MTYKVTRSQEYLEHHGIKGQKWGVRQGPPYPLDYDEHTGAEKRFNAKAALSRYDDSFDPKKNSNKDLHNQLGKAYKKIDEEKDARQKDIRESYKAEAKAIKKGDYTDDERYRLQVDLEARYKNVNNWNKSVYRQEREYVKNKMLETYGDTAVARQQEYKKQKRNRGIIAGAVTAGAGILAYTALYTALLVASK